MSQIHSDLGKETKACVRKVRLFDDEMDEFGHTPSGQNRLRLNNFLNRG